MEATVHSVFYNRDGTRLDSTQPQPMYPGNAAWYGNVYMEDLPKGLEVDTKRFGVTNGIIPNATLGLVYRPEGEYVLILEQQIGAPGEPHSFTRTMDIGGEGSSEQRKVSDIIARRGIRLRRPTPDGGMQEIHVFVSTPRQENMAILNREAEQRLRERFASRN